MIDTDPALFDGGRKLPLVEDFYTIQGEGFHAGKLRIPLEQVY